MNRWETYKKNTKEIGVGESIVITFQANAPLPPIVEIKPGCSCSSAEYDKNTRQLKVKYTGESIPKHLAHQGWFLAGKKVTITYTDKTMDVLAFITKVIKKGI